MSVKGVSVFERVTKKIKNLRGPIYLVADGTNFVSTGTKAGLGADTGSGYLEIQIADVGTRWIQLYQ